MATAAFRSTTRRTSIGDSNSNSSPSSSSSARHRRSRSVSRFSHHLPTDDTAEEPSVVRRGKFVNTVRGSGFPEISLDDLAIEMFSLSSPSEVSSSAVNNECESSNRRGRSAVNGGDAASVRRGRSVSRRGSRVSELRSNTNNNNNSNNSNVDKSNINGEFGGENGSLSRRRRSLSVAPKSYLVSDSESEHFQKNRSRPNSAHISVRDRQKPSLHKSTASSQQRGLRKCSSQKDLFKSYDGYSSYSSTLTDDEGKDACYKGHGLEKAAYALNKPNDGRKANDLPNYGLQPTESNVLEAVCTVRRNYKTKLEESEKRKEELLAEIMLEEKRGKELKKMVGELVPKGTKTSPTKKPMRGRKRSNDRIKVPKHLVEDADRIIEDFISSVEETDISSFDGERSDTSSIAGGPFKPMIPYRDTEFCKTPLKSAVLPGEMDGVVLPWLKWETGDDGTPLLVNENKQHPATPKTVLLDALEEGNRGVDQEQSVNSKSSRGSWSPVAANSFCNDVGETSRTEEVESRKSHLLSRVPRRSRVDVDDYLKPSSSENFISEVWRQRYRIDSGGLLICNSGPLGNFLL